MNIKNHERNSLKIAFYFFKASCGGGAFSIDNDNTILVLPQFEATASYVNSISQTNANEQLICVAQHEKSADMLADSWAVKLVKIV